MTSFYIRKEEKLNFIKIFILTLILSLILGIEVLADSYVAYLILSTFIGFIMALISWASQYKYVEKIEFKNENITIYQRHYLKKKIYRSTSNLVKLKKSSAFIDMAVIVPATHKLENFRLNFSEWSELDQIESLLVSGDM
ncbi:hypothetical protein [Flammeovirga aprica]|uniref:Uncharacterized protein n=1 Tax=Flammeovirga aprica JL-4 TaxID=694437 RepID=A0A7X9RZ13_9BACT|nr:hypothetical protein [Flammeovirga aprica]NME71242.1 hypothetical protein [Flammeovirga aprica JL-4]